MNIKKINLKELNVETLSQWPMPMKLGLVAGISIVILFLGYWFIIQSNFEQYDILVTKEESLKKDFKTKQHLASNLQAYRDQLQIMQERFGAMLKLLPTQNEMPSLLEEISKTGIASGLKFELFAPQKEVPHDFYVELPIQIIVQGSYFQLANFLSRVAEMNRIVTLHEFSIAGFNAKDNKTAPGKEAKSVSEDELVMTITAKIYRYRSK